MTKDMSDRINLFGFVMTLFIVIYHCRYPFNSVNAVDERINYAVTSIGGMLAYIAMCWFFSTSGFLLFRNLSLKNYAEKLKKRAITLLIPYFIWQFVDFVLKTVIRLIHHERPALSELFQNLTGGVFWPDRFPSNEPLWYLYILFLLTALSPILLLILKNKKVGWLVTVAVTFTLYILSAEKNALFEKVASFGYMRNALSYIPAFMIGAFMGHYSENSDGTDKLKHIIFFVAASLLLEPCFSGITVDTVGKILPTLLIYFAPMISAVRDRKVYRLSFLIYAIHDPMNIIKDHMLRSLYEFLPYTSVASIAVRIIYPTIIIVLAAAIYKTLQKVSPKLLRTVTGGRV